MADDAWTGDGWAELDDREASASARAAIVASLDAMQSDPEIERVNARFLDALALAPADRVLELAAGLGQLAIQAAARAGRVVALDRAAFLLAELRRRADAAGRPDIEVVVGDVRATGLADHGFDVVYARQLLSHVGPTAAVLAEARRLLRPGGRLGLFQTLPLAGRIPQPHLFHAGLELTASAKHDAYVAVELARRCREAGFVDVREEVTGVYTHDVSHATWWPSVEEAAGALVRAEAVEAADAGAWLDEVRAANARRECMLLLPIVLVYARAPETSG